MTFAAVDRFLKPRMEAVYVLLRAGAGLMFAFHGMQKILGVMSTFRPPALSQLWFGGIIELVCGIAIAAGAFTACTALLASGTMAVAYIQFHWKLQLGPSLLPAINKGELALLYALVFLFVACRGSGPWSVDHWRAGRRRG
jgi:putative oxidoreductase